MNHKNSEIKNIIWDWNGTLLDDVDHCHQIVQKLALKQNLAPFNQQRYKDVFGFPIQAYYKKLGFDFRQISYDDLADEFINLYLENPPPLFHEALDILEYYGEQFQQEVISAYKHDRLVGIIRDLGLEKFFIQVKGIGNDLAATKHHLFENRFQEIDPSETIIIGDTLHDAEIAHHFKTCCILISHGHQSHERLTKNCFQFEVVKDFKELKLTLSKNLF